MYWCLRVCMYLLPWWFCQLCNLISHTIYIAWVNFMHDWQDELFEVDSERQIFDKVFHDNSILLLMLLPRIHWKQFAKGIFFHISVSWWCLPWGLNQGLHFYKPTQYQLNYWQKTTYVTGHYKPSVRTFHTTRVICINFIRDWRDQHFNDYSER